MVLVINSVAISITLIFVKDNTISSARGSLLVEKAATRIRDSRIQRSGCGDRVI